MTEEDIKDDLNAIQDAFKFMNVQLGAISDWMLITAMCQIIQSEVDPELKEKALKILKAETEVIL